jgi:PTS system cellobiose-specific IIC component
MKKFLDWMSSTVAPKMDELTNNVWLSALQTSIMKTLPMILVGSLITLYNVVRNVFPNIPDLTPIRDYTFGLISIFIVFLIPFTVLELKKKNKAKFIAGFTGISLYMILVNPEITEAGHMYNFASFGAGGMFVAITAGLVTALIMSFFSGFSFFSEDSVVPDFVKQWFDAMLPIAVVITLGWFIVIYLGFDMFTFIVNLFSPLNNIAQTLPGMVLLYFIPTLFYSMGISGWVFQPILNPIMLMAITANIDAVASGGEAILPNTMEATYAFLMLGGRGATLPLAIMMLFAKSTRLKTLSRASIVPSVLNINEPIVFGTVVWNPLLMVPMWIIGAVLPLITYFMLSLGIVAIPAEVFNMWYMPVGISAWLITRSLSAIMLVAVNLAVAAAIWYPFYKMYDKQELSKEIGEGE